MNVEVKSISVKQAREFLDDTMMLVYRGDLTHEAAAAKIELLWDCIVHSMLKNKEEWGSSQIADYGFLDTHVQWLKSTLVEQKLAQATIDTSKDKIIIDGVQVHPMSLNFQSKTEFIYSMGEPINPRDKHKTLTVYWSEPCDSNPVHTVAPPPPPPYHNIGDEQKLNTGKGEDSHKFQIPPSTFSSIQQIQSALKKDDYSYLNKLLKKAFASWIGGYQPIAKEDQQTATPPKSR